MPGAPAEFATPPGLPKTECPCSRPPLRRNVLISSTGKDLHSASGGDCAGMQRTLK